MEVMAKLSEGEPKFRSNKIRLATVSQAAFLALFAVLFLWGFWGKGINALGLNLTVFGFMTAAWFVFQAHSVADFKKIWFWIIPIDFMILSFFLYENPFVKIINLLVLPVSFALFFNWSVLKDKEKKIWNLHFIGALMKRVFDFVQHIDPAARSFGAAIFPKEKNNKTMIQRILLGLCIFFLLAALIVIPLLSSADPIFANRIDFIMDFIQRILSMSFINKLLFFGLISVGLLSLWLAWIPSFDVAVKKTDFKIDSIVAGIVMGGVLLLYIIFLWIQVERLWVSTLPLEFKATESLVKTGFWQLFWLSVINVIGFFLYYRNTNQLVQRLLSIFTLASLLLLLSAGQKMYLYVTLYGFSYEKFYAFYTVIYTLMLFCWLIYCLFHHERKDIFKFLILSFLWMYSVSTILPVEKFVWKANLALSQNSDSRIKLYELRMLSNDVLSDVGEYIQQNPAETNVWQSWITEQKARVRGKAWYEKNLANWLE